MTKAYPKSFTRDEMLKSNTATRLGIENVPASDEIEANIIDMALFLQQLRDAIEDKTMILRPIKVFSCYRCPRLNKAVGGSKTSAHMRGLAADIVAEDWTPYQLAIFIRNNFVFDQLILEFDQWVHVGIVNNGKPRRQILTASKQRVGGKLKTVYSDGLA